MRYLLNPRALLLLALSLAVLFGLASAQQMRLFERGWFAVQEWRHAPEWRERSLWLPDYRVEIEAQPIAGLAANLSALTFDPDRRSLFAVTNKQAELLELSLDGQIVRRIPLTGFGDAEAVEYISPGIYVISDEHQQRLFKVHVDARTRWLDAADSEQLSLSIGEDGNNGFEGLAYDSVGRRLFVAKERKPLRILQVLGFPSQDEGQPFAVHVQGDAVRDQRLFVSDLSSLVFDQGSGHLLLLSDESRLVLELDQAGKPISSLSLLAGMHGLKRSVPQAEGLAMDDLGDLYIVSEPNLFYRFKKPVGE
ncbi:MAG: SdiA-regulated domain-containing protein [Pseudomonas sp.]|uniref:SdiA-regulated domain-containing protein n=1 Tax=Pseudomonas sp. TaxID=306 RepID=UPI00273364E1|nr:SdiA-regulated domain-containing protein [Pseudomonas sp.]MDP3848750.1 SdiA-regulated domain-containing protein [Pseudomonas sp.]